MSAAALIYSGLLALIVFLLISLKGSALLIFCVALLAGWLASILFCAALAYGRALTREAALFLCAFTFAAGMAAGRMI